MLMASSRRIATIPQKYCRRTREENHPVRVSVLLT